MSEMINNREQRQKILKQLIRELHEGATVEDVQARFAKLIDGISATEISEMEQKLIQEGMPVEEVQRLCDVHASVFKGSIEEIHGTQEATEIPGHPLHTFHQENRALEQWFEERLQPIMLNWLGDQRERLESRLYRLSRNCAESIVTMPVKKTCSFLFWNVMKLQRLRR